MIQNCRDSILQDRKFHEMQLKRYRAELWKTRNFNHLHLSVKQYSDHFYYSVIDDRDSRHSRKYVGSHDDHTVQIIQKRRFLTESVRRIENNLHAMDRFIRNYRSIDPYDIRNDLPKAYKFKDRACFDIAGAIDVEHWGKKEYCRAVTHPEHLTHIDNKGELLRSKSEVIIANALAAHRIPYRLEIPVQIEDELRIPDFTILSKRLNREIYWEHFGRIFDAEYRADYARKLFLYSKIDILPGHNLIITFDDISGNIDARDVERMIETFF